MHFVVCRLFAVFYSLLGTIHAQISKKEKQDYENLVKYMRQHGATVDKRLVLQRDANGVRGLYTTELVPADTLLFTIPFDLVIVADDDCELVQALNSLLQPTNERHVLVAPFADLDLYLPTFWKDRSSLQQVPPFADAHRHTAWYQQSCLSRRQVPHHALQLTVAHATSEGFWPLFPLINHHAGLVNIRVEFGDDQVHVLSTKPIDGQIYNHYGSTTSSDLFRDYGFVEDWPRQWLLTVEPSSWWLGRLVVEWMGVPRHFLLVVDQNEQVSIVANANIELQSQVQAGKTSAEPPSRPLTSIQASTFRQVAQAFLAKQPTTAQQDLELLQQEQDVTAIQYRWRYKRDVELALKSLQAKNEL